MSNDILLIIFIKIPFVISGHLWQVSSYTSGTPTFINSRENHCAVTNIGQNGGLKYTLAVQLYQVKYSISLTDFECHVVQT